MGKRTVGPTQPDAWVSYILYYIMLCYAMLCYLVCSFPRRHSDPRDIDSRPLEDVVAQHVCFALLVGRHGARSQADGSVGACAAALGERAWVDAED